MGLNVDVGVNPDVDLVGDGDGDVRRGQQLRGCTPGIRLPAPSCETSERAVAVAVAVAVKADVYVQAHAYVNEEKREKDSTAARTTEQKEAALGSTAIHPAPIALPPYARNPRPDTLAITARERFLAHKVDTPWERDSYRLPRSGEGENPEIKTDFLCGGLAPPTGCIAPYN